MAESEKSKRNPPKGGRKGGTIFPRIGLAKAIEYSNNVVRKTHSAAQPAETIYVGVFGSKGPEGQVRASALKQYGLMKGDAKAFVATDLAKEIHVATPDQKINLYRKAFLSAKTFNHIYTTYQGDLVSPARLNQAAATAKVHPDSLDDCTTIFIEGAITAELATRQGDDVQLIGSAEIGSGATVKPTEVEDEATGDEEEKHLDDSAGDTTVQLKPATPPAPAARAERTDPPPPMPKQAGITVAFTVDSSLDADKLQKHLELLRKYGVI